MTYKAYLENIYAKTGKTPEEYLEMAEARRLVKYSNLLSWLKTECGLGHGHANAIILYIQDPVAARKKLQKEEEAAAE